MTLYSALTEALQEVPPTREEIIAAQRADTRLYKIIQFLQTGKFSKEDKNNHDIKSESRGYLMDGDMLVYFAPSDDKELDNSGNGFKAAIPRTLVRRALFACHGHPMSGHSGITKTKYRAKQLYHWKRMSKDKVTAVILDNCTKYVELFPLSTATGTIVASKLHEVGCRHGFPKKIISDNGPQFISKVYSEYCKRMGVKKLLTSPFNPSANPTERANRNLKMMLAIFSDVHSHWPRFLNNFAFASQTEISEATGSTPMLLNSGRVVPPPWDPRIISHVGKLDRNNPQDYINRLLSTIRAATEVMCTRVQKNYEKHRALHHKKYNVISFEINDLVWRNTHFLSAKKEKFSAGLAKRRNGPWKIIKVLGGCAYKLEKLEDGSIEPSINIKELTPYIPEFPVEFWLEGQSCASNSPQSTSSNTNRPCPIDRS
uniref:RNA-directed DNA polymerase n=1 Tax=Strigamia maritima TaxID=126957 RepID=T1JBX9_STRMM